MNGYRLQPHEHISDLREVCPVVNDYLDRELFKDEYGADNYTVNDILTTCYVLAIDDLTNYGVKFHVGIEDLIEDFYTAKGIYYLLKFLQPTELMKLLSSIEMVEHIETIIDEPDNFAIELIFSYIYERYPDDFTLQRVDEMMPMLYCDPDQIKVYFTNICDTIRNGDHLVNIPNITKVKTYIENTRNKRFMISNLTMSVCGMPSIQGTLDMTLISHLLRTYDLDKVSPDEVNIYSSVDTKDCPEALKMLQAKMMEAHHKRSPHHIEHWELQTEAKETLERCPEYIILIVVSLIEIETTPQEFRQKVSDLLQKYAFCFTPKTVTLIEQIRDYLHPAEETN